MRNVGPFECPRCGAPSPFGTTCATCDTDMLDRLGQPPLSAGDLAYDRGTLPSWIVALRRRWRRRAFERARKTMPLAAIASARDGVCRVRGRAHVLRAVVGPLGEPVGAFATQRIHAMEVAVSFEGNRQGVIVRVELTARCGRFAVVDDTGVAIVDDDCFLVDYADRPSFEDRGAGHVVVADGTVIEVLGPARWHTAADARVLVPDRAGYREAPAVLVFDGTPDARLAILL